MLTLVLIFATGIVIGWHLRGLVVRWKFYRRMDRAADRLGMDREPDA